MQREKNDENEMVSCRFSICVFASQLCSTSRIPTADDDTHDDGDSD